MGIFSLGKKDNNSTLVNDEVENSYNDVPDYSGYNPDCPMCNKTMGYSYMQSEFKCHHCGYIMDEADWEHDFDYDDPDNPPYGCEACGGPWPHCKTSCKLFDD